MGVAPNFLYIGTSKAGSTWIFKLLSWHPQIYVYPDKDTAFFTSAFSRGQDWYLDRFHPDPQHKAVGEVAHTYLISRHACNRIHQMLPEVKLLVCLREPVERMYSQYLDGIKNGKLHGSLEEEIDRTASLTNRSRYGTHLAMYLEQFPRDQIHIASFDRLTCDPEGFSAEIFEFLGVDVLKIPQELKRNILPAAQPRVRGVAMAAKRVARLARAMGLAGWVGRAKTSPTLRNLLYSPFTDDSRPRMPSSTEARLRELMTGEVQRLDAVIGTDFCHLWHYPPTDLQA